MADFAKVVSSVSLATMNPPPTNQLTKEADTDLVAGDEVYLKSNDKFAKANGTALDALAKPVGMIVTSKKAGQPATAFWGVEITYTTEAAPLTPGQDLFVSTNPGLLATTATTGGVAPCARAYSTTTVYVFGPR
jgi:hypothetical protein